MPRSSSAFQIPAFFPLRQHFSRALLCPGALAALGPSLRGAGDAAGAFALPEMSKSLRETRVSLWTWPMGLSSRHRLLRLLFFTRTPTCTSLLALSRKIFICFLYFSLLFFFWGGPRRLQRSRRSGCCHGNSRCRNSFGLSLGNPSWSCQAIGSRGGTLVFGEGWVGRSSRRGRQGRLKWDRCLPIGRDGSCRVQSRISGGRRVGKASAIKPQASAGKGKQQ